MPSTRERPAPRANAENRAGLNTNATYNITPTAECDTAHAVACVSARFRLPVHLARLICQLAVGGRLA